MIMPSDVQLTMLRVVNDRVRLKLVCNDVGRVTLELHTDDGLRYSEPLEQVMLIGARLRDLGLPTRTE